jgi:hypothetical protein
VTRPVLKFRHARTPNDPTDSPHCPRLASGPVLGTVAVLAATLVATLAPPSQPPVDLGPLKLAAMSNSEMSDRAERDPDYARRLGHRMTEDFGYKGDRQWHCLRHLWRLESSWRVHADNPYSRAYGIPQANPGSKMSTAGDHWQREATTQIRWGLRYVHNRYGWPCVAMRHKQSHGWY